jgi:hypothetical protein
MSPFEFVAAFFSVVLGLGVAHLLSGVSGLLEARDRVRTYWVHSVWVLTTILLLVHSWWGIWSLKAAPAWSYPAFLCFVAYLIALYLISTLLLPRVAEHGAIDLGAHFDTIRPVFLSFVAAVFALGTVLNYSLFAADFFSIFIVIPGIACVLILVGATIQNRPYHAALALFVLFSLLAVMLSDTTTLTS